MSRMPKFHVYTVASLNEFEYFMREILLGSCILIVLDERNNNIGGMFHIDILHTVDE